MKLRLLHPVAALAAILLCAAFDACPVTPAAAQTYHNIVNQRFRTVGNGPQSAIIVDVADPNDSAAVKRAVDTQVGAVMRARRPSLDREIAFLSRHHLLKPGHNIPYVTTVLLRHNGRLVLPEARNPTRDPAASNKLTYVAQTTGQFAFDAPTAASLNNVVNTVLYPQLVGILGPPFQTNTVTILNEDPDPNNPHKVDSIIGVVVVVNGSNIQIELPNFSTDQDKYLGLLQAMAQTFHVPYTLGYDAWEMGMARAAAVVAAQQLQPTFQQNLPQGDVVDPTGGFNYTPYYDALNQPALGNNTFLPPTKSGQTLTGLGGMLVPRLEMSSTAWLKCYIENRQFFINFNTAYYNAVTANPGGNIPNDVSQLEPLAKQAVGGTVEGQPFDLWFQQQYVLDTSVIPGPKLYAFVTPTLPDATRPEDGVAVTLLYYQTTSTGDEIDLSGACTPTYFDNVFQSSLVLTQEITIPITAGEGDTAPLFNEKGGANGSNPQSLIVMDFPVDNNYVRVNFPANADTVSATNQAPSSYFGVVAGANSNELNGQVTATFTGGNSTPIASTVGEAAFIGVDPGGSIPDNFTQVTLSYQPFNASGQANGSPIVFKRNVFQRKDQTSTTGLSNVSSLFVLVAPTPTGTLTHTFLNGPRLISLPIQPLNPDLAAVFGLPANQTLIAQWRQNATPNPDQYLRYPSLPLYQPGYGIWTNFNIALNNDTITGVPTDNQGAINVGLQYGWNMIGDPFNTGVSLTADPTAGGGGVQVQYLGGGFLSLQDAITNTPPLIAIGVYGYDPGDVSGTQGYVDVSNTNQTLPTNSPFFNNLGTIQPWQGYWIRVLVTEGVTLTFYNPSPNTRAVLRPTKAAIGSRSSRAAVRAPERGAWNLPLSVQDSEGHIVSATFGQSPHGSDRFVPSLDAASPPPFTRAAALRVRFPHTDWDAGVGSGGGDFLSDIRRSASPATWNVAVDVPQPGKSYTLSWGGTARLPRGTRLTLVDLDTNTRVLMDTTNSYAFTPNQSEVTRQFKIIADTNSPNLLTITNLRVDAPMFGGRAIASATISYEANGVGEASIQIRGPSGRIVRHLEQGRAITSGVNQSVWDLRDDHGRSLPAGLYLVEVQARTPDGHQTRAIMPHPIVR